MMIMLAIKNEFVKCLKSPLSIGLLFVLTLPVLTVFLFIYPMPYTEFEQRVLSTNSDLNPYNYFYKWFQLIFTFLLIPYYSVFLIWFFEIERKAKGWKYLKSLPLRTINVVWSKLLTGMIHIAISKALVILALIGVINHLKNFKQDWFFESYSGLDTETLLLIMGSVYLASLPAFIILFIITMIFDNPGIIITCSVLIGYFNFSLNPFFFHKEAIRLFWTIQSGASINLGIYIKTGVFILILLSALKLFNKRLISSL